MSDGAEQERVQIYVYLPDEATDTWRPVWADRLTDDTYRIVGEVPSDEMWEFPPGAVVRCRTQRFYEGSGLCAYELASDARQWCEWRGVFRDVRAILMREWNPVGCEPEDECDDEYDGVALTVTGMLLRGGNPQDVYDYVSRTENEWIGSVNVPRLQKTIEALEALVTPQR